MASALEWWRLPAFAEEFLPLPEFEPDEWQTTWLATGPPPCHLYFKQCFGLIAIIVFFCKALIFCNDIWRFSRISNIFLTQRIIKKNVSRILIRKSPCSSFIHSQTGLLCVSVYVLSQSEIKCCQLTGKTYSFKYRLKWLMISGSESLSRKWCSRNLFTNSDTD